MDELGDDPSVEELVASDLEFHRVIVHSSGNLGAVFAARRTVRTHHPGPDPARSDPGGRGPTQEDAVRRTLHEHRAILGALRDRDAEAARSWATAHIASVEQWLRSAL